MRAFKQITRATPKILEMEAVWEGIDACPDGTAALIVSAWLDRHLEEALKLKFIEGITEQEATSLFENQGPLESLGAKTNIAYVLGVIGKKTKQNIILATQIRNVFAHAPELVTFDTPEVKARCRGFDIIKALGEAPHIRYAVTSDVIPGARYQFLESCVAMVVALLLQQQEFLNARDLSFALLRNRSSEAKLADMMSRPEASFLP